MQSRKVEDNENVKNYKTYYERIHGRNHERNHIEY